MANKAHTVDVENVAMTGFTETYIPKDPVFESVTASASAAIYLQRRYADTYLPSMILVHSLGGDPRATWTGSREVKDVNNSSRRKKRYVTYSRYWPNHPSFGRSAFEPRILTYGYSSNVTSFCGSGSSNSSFLGIAEDLVTELLAYRRQAPRRPLFFVGYSLGGYLIKEVLRSA